MHSVLHRWCGYMAEGEERQELGCLAAWLVASNVPMQSDADFWKAKAAHGSRSPCQRVDGEKRGSNEERTIEPSILPAHSYNHGCLLSDEERRHVEQMYQRALEGFNPLLETRCSWNALLR
jgi:hypothetical protein